MAQFPLTCIAADAFCQPHHQGNVDKSFDGNPFVIAGRQRDCPGFGTHAPGEVVVDLGRGAVSFSGEVGIDEEWSHDKGQVNIEVADLDAGRILWRSDLISFGDEPVKFSVPLVNVRRISIRWIPGPLGSAGCHVDFLDAKFESSRAPRGFFPTPDAIESKNIIWNFPNLKEGQRAFQHPFFAKNLGSATPKQPLVTTYPAQDEQGSLSAPPSLFVIQADGAHTCEPVFVRKEQEELENGDVATTFVLRDPVYPVEVEQRVVVRRDIDVFEVSRVIRNTGDSRLTLLARDSANVMLPPGKPWIRTFHGSWGREMGSSEGPLLAGTLQIGRALTAHNSQDVYPGLFLGWDGAIKEDRGTVIGAWFATDQDWQMRVTRGTIMNLSDQITLSAGSWEVPRSLAPGEEFRTPTLLLSASRKGLGPVTRAFQAWQRTRGGIMNPFAKRRVVLNSWEGLYFTFNEEKISRMIRDAAALGAELFVLDDGWFAEGVYARDNDCSGLGDWTVNQAKLPHGLGFLAEECRKAGIDFGLWFEPEMVNKHSKLFDAHPDWVLRTPGRELRFGRGHDQLMLDLSRPEVEEYVYHAVADVLAATPGISYVKWDHNMRGLGHGTQRKGADQGALSDLYEAAFLRVARRLRESFPNVEFQLCASGGGRADASSMRNFEEFWGSDQTNPRDRIFIQWGFLHFHNPCTIAAHVNRDNRYSFKFRSDVAMCGRMGIELDPAKFSKEQMDELRASVAAYKSIRPILHTAEVFRGRNPHSGTASEMAYVLADKSAAVLFAFDLQGAKRTENVKVPGLDKNAQYSLREINPDPNGTARISSGVASGAKLAKTGIPVAFNGDFCSAVVLLERV